MLLFNRRAVLMLALGVGVSACGFTPVYKLGTAANNLKSQIEIDLVKGRNGFELREELENKLGRADSGAPYVLTFKLTFNETSLAVTEGGGTTRNNLNGVAAFTVRRKDTNSVVYKDSVRNATVYGTTSKTFPSGVAQRDTNTRLAKALAAQIANRIAITADGWAK